MEHCSDIVGDRALGEFWERQFCAMAAKYQMTFTPMQINKNGAAEWYCQIAGHWEHFLLPDVTVWTWPGQHHEIKHKSPTRFDAYGLEEYRFNSLMQFASTTQQDVMYTIHDHQLSGGRDETVNDISHWVTVNVLCLNGTHCHRQAHGKSWVNGQKVSGIAILYWKTDMWQPLTDYWQNTTA